MQFPKPRPRLLDKRDEQREVARIKRAVYREVDARDQKLCRCCGRHGNPYGIAGLGRIHRHHIRYASAGGPLTSSNILSLCWICHLLEHGKQLFIIGTDANRWIDFEIHEAAVVEVFGTKVLPWHVRIVLRCPTP